MTDFSEQAIRDHNIAADTAAQLPEVLRDVIKVLEWSVSQKTPPNAVAPALQRLHDLAVRLEAYKSTPAVGDENYRR